LKAVPLCSDAVLFNSVRSVHHVALSQLKKRVVPIIIEEGPERDLVNFPRPVRLDEPGKLRVGFVPDEWFQFFYNKTGVTGPYLFGVGFITFICSKEYYVMDHEYYAGITLFGMTAYFLKKFGPQIKEFAMKLGKDVEDSQIAFQKATMDSIVADIDAEKKYQWSAEGERMLLHAKKENVALQIEATYRERISKVYSEVKRRLDYQLERQNVERSISQKHMVEWIVSAVRKSITPQQEKESLQQCINELKLLASVAKA